MSTCKSNLDPRANPVGVHVPIPLRSTCQSCRGSRAKPIGAHVLISSGPRTNPIHMLGVDVPMPLFPRADLILIDVRIPLGSTCQSRRGTHVFTIGVHVPIPLESTYQSHWDLRANLVGLPCQSYWDSCANSIGVDLPISLGPHANPIRFNVLIPSGYTCESNGGPRANPVGVHVSIQLRSTCQSRRGPLANLIGVHVPKNVLSSDLENVSQAHHLQK